ncbi:MAG TPA: hypothetical protein VMZ29_05235 [Candidatus Bathyarchaeia archaeon]|nr:hypothetical protein [Candidatus Bathyarchaeia archaeon]
MSKRQNKVYCLFLVICCCGLFATDNNENINCAENPLPFFYIDVLAPTSYTLRQIPTLMVEQLPKIGIGVDIFDHTGWNQIIPRTWSYPGQYPIPPYDEGGFDILFIG